MAVIAQVAHRTPGRLRLRLPQKRRDLAFFLTLYEELRQTSAIGEVTMNPVTGSVLLRFEETDLGELNEALRHSRLVAVPNIPPAVRPPARLPEPDEAEPDALLARRVTDVRAVVFLIMAGISVHQLLQGKLLAPILTLLLYGVDLASNYRRERQVRDASP